MKLHIITIVLDGTPFITWHLPVFNQLNLDWTWHVVEGAADNKHCTAWCKPQEPRLSRDGTSEYLTAMAAAHPRIRLYRRQLWDGKVSMFNTALAAIREPCILMEIDADELWTAEQLAGVVRLFDDMPEICRAEFYCRYFLGQNIITVGENCYGNNPGEWRRAWRFSPGDVFERHEPPVLRQKTGPHYAMRELTRKRGLVFDHYAYAFESQVAYKEQFYGYSRAVEHWRRLQANQRWPVNVKTFLPWVDERAQADALHKR